MPFFFLTILIFKSLLSFHYNFFCSSLNPLASTRMTAKRARERNGTSGLTVFGWTKHKTGFCPRDNDSQMATQCVATFFKNYRLLSNLWFSSFPIFSTIWPSASGELILIYITESGRRSELSSLRILDVEGIYLHNTRKPIQFVSQ